MRIKIGLFAFLVFFLVACSNHLYITPSHQATRHWCWASTLVMLAKHYKGFQVNDCEMVSAINEETGRTFFCCDNPDGDCLRGGYPSDVMIGLENVLKIKYRLVYRAAEFDEIISSINAGNPILILRYYIWGGGHAQLITGYNWRDKTILVADPTHGKELRVPFDKFTSSVRRGVWRTTFFITDTPLPYDAKPMCEWLCAEGDCFRMRCKSREDYLSQ